MPTYQNFFYIHFFPLFMVLFCKKRSLSPNFKEILCKFYMHHQRFSSIFPTQSRFLFLRSSFISVRRFRRIIGEFARTSSQKYHELVCMYQFVVHNMPTKLCDYERNHFQMALVCHLSSYECMRHV